jgi:hypothetical protein
LLLAIAAAGPPLRAELLELPEKLADRRLEACRKAIDELHEKALRSRKPWTEDELRARVPEDDVAQGQIDQGHGVKVPPPLTPVNLAGTGDWTGSKRQRPLCSCPPARSRLKESRI